jgi:hypothetical protein
LEILVPILLDPRLAKEMIQSLPTEGQAAIADLLGSDGRMTWSFFTRRYGEVREMGSGRRDRARARPYLEPTSIAEVLFYRALIGRTFFDSPSGPEEFAYIPNDLMPLLHTNQAILIESFGRAALPAEHSLTNTVSERILADACTMLAALRMGLSGEQIPLSDYPGCYPLNSESLKALLAASDLLDEDGAPESNPTRLFLEAEPGKALAQLAKGWQNSQQLNELSLLPHLILEGEWRNDPLRTRGAIIEFLEGVPRNTWWNIESFVEAIRQVSPDFQRPAGDYDSWFIRRAENGEYLRGFENWDYVDGELIQFFIIGPLHWLGILDLATTGKGKSLTAFRFSDWSEALLQGVAPTGLPKEDQKVVVRSDGRLIMSTRVARSVRYQLSRFCEWDELERKNYHYHVSPSSLRLASKNGLLTSHLLSLLRSHAEQVPPNLVTALERWDEFGRQARIEHAFVLRLASPEILTELRASRAARFLGDPLGPAAVIVKSGAREKVLAALTELGYLGEIIFEDPKTS